MKLFVVKDMKAKLYLKPFVERSTPSALRGWELCCNEPGEIFNKFPHDFRLYEIANFDEANGSLTPHDEPIDLGSAADILRPSQSSSEPGLPFPSQKPSRPLSANA